MFDVIKKIILKYKIKKLMKRNLPEDILKKILKYPDILENITNNNLNINELRTYIKKYPD